ncbi:BTB POZ domain-containing At3g49900 [Olea europaea subsp. europaea]|uniref:BTB POZ domain-containing At3g49900 n=1 Tax=Olea europaea subsp. europaea TaxID=158383 RepID=A0A8S0UHL6_OLEEU|nr:BTB POZ domain-containing At3g49900 [Olea europaea subsp. europaea]
MELDLDLELELEAKGWNDLGVVGTIYEDEDEDAEDEDSSSIPSLSPSPTPTPRVESWQLDPDVVINVQDSCFRLHKGPLIARSGYLSRQLSKLSEITLNPPLNITAETFSLATDFCYGKRIVIMPSNVAALRTAAELLEMTGTNGIRDENLQQKTESYFRSVTVNQEYTSIVLKACLALLPEAETTAFLVSRCIGALSLTGGTDAVMSCMVDVGRVGVDDFQLILESMSQRSANGHDLLYRIIDFYLMAKENNGKVTDDEKTRICNYIDCSVLQPRLLMHAVQNPRLPLRFVVQAMFAEQLNTRRSIISAVDHRGHHHRTGEDTATLGSILERDAAQLRAAQLKATMNVTKSRIQSLEKELRGMKKVLNESESIRNKIDSSKSVSFRLISENKVERGQIGSVSSVNIRSIGNKVGTGECSSSEESFDRILTAEKNLGRRLINGLKSAFRLSSKKSESRCPVKVERQGERIKGVLEKQLS